MCCRLTAAARDRPLHSAPAHARDRPAPMLRLTDLALPLDHDDAALAAAICARLGIAAEDLAGYTVAKRSYDARRRGAITLIYSVDVDTPRDRELLQLTDAGARIAATPDTADIFVALAPPEPSLRPLVIVMGPCGLFAA